MALKFGEDTCRAGALERLTESRYLLAGEYYSGPVYLAGRAVEGMLRALIWRHDSEVRRGDKSLETGHDLRHLLGEVQGLGLVNESESDCVSDESTKRLPPVGK